MIVAVEDLQIHPLLVYKIHGLWLKTSASYYL